MPAARSSVVISSASRPPVVSTTNTSTAVVGCGEHALVAARQQRAVDAEREADARRGRAAEILDEAVVAAAAAERVLGRVERAALELERRAAVVVEPAHEPHVDRERDAEVVQPRLHAVAKWAAASSDQNWSIVGAAAMIGASSRRLESSTRSGFLFSVSRLCLATARRRRPRSDAAARRRSAPGRRARRGVDEQRHLLQPEPPVELPRQRDHLDVEIGVVGAEHLDADLVELPVAAALGLLVPEVRARVPRLPRASGAAARRTPGRRWPSARAAARRGGRPCRRSRTSPW